MTEGAGASEHRVGAVEAALIALGAPDRVALSPPHPLPHGAIDLIRVAAGDDTHAATLAQQFGVDVRTIDDAALHFVHVAMFHPDSDYFRVLGVNPEDDDDTLKLHFRWLQKWLHPDRDPEGWVSAYSERVNIAWAQLRRPDRREAYRERLRDLASTAVVAPAGLAKHVAADAGVDIASRTSRLVSSRWARRVPVVLAVTTVVLAVFVFGAHRAGERMLAEERSRAAQASTGEAPEVRELPGSALHHDSTNSGVAPPLPLDDMPFNGPGATAAVLAPEQDPPAQAIDDASGGEPPQADAAERTRPAEVTLRVPRDRDSADQVSSLPAELPLSSPEAVDAVTDLRVERADVSVAARAAVVDPGNIDRLDGETREEQPEAIAASVDAADGSATREPSGSMQTLPAPAAASPDALASGTRQSPPESVDDVLVHATSVDPTAGRRLLNQFSAAYRSGEVQQVVILFAPNARTPSGNLLDLHEQYGATFAGSSRRSLEFLDVEWRVLPNGLEGVGRYEWAMRPRSGASTRATSGRMRVVIEFIDGRPLISVLDQQDVG